LKSDCSIQNKKIGITIEHDYIDDISLTCEQINTEIFKIINLPNFEIIFQDSKNNFVSMFHIYKTLVEQNKIVPTDEHLICILKIIDRITFNDAKKYVDFILDHKVIPNNLCFPKGAVADCRNSWVYYYRYWIMDVY
jgi:hypothetical protein